MQSSQQQYFSSSLGTPDSYFNHNICLCSDLASFLSEFAVPPFVYDIFGRISATLNKFTEFLTEELNMKPSFGRGRPTCPTGRGMKKSGANKINAQCLARERLESHKGMEASRWSHDQERTPGHHLSPKLSCLLGRSCWESAVGPLTIITWRLLKPELLHLRPSQRWAL